MSILSVVSKSPIFIEFCWSAQIHTFCSYGISKWAYDRGDNDWS